jgi:hypothetical protein
LRLLQEAFQAIASSPDADLRRKVICDLGLTLRNLGDHLSNTLDPDHPLLALARMWGQNK